MSVGNQMGWAAGNGHKKPGLGAGSLDYYNNKFHNEFLKKAQSRVGQQYNDMTWLKRKNDLKHFKSEKTNKKLRQIDNKNFKIFVRLSTVKPIVPQVVRMRAPSQPDI